ncbi:MAG: DUF4391 domain-containing protein [Myxococcales bacterium]|nr:MAG: DUF4391 domain-containing protein [Myxococcales bacterium]
MTPADFYRAMALPDECLLAKRVFKKLFYENANLTAADKRALSSDVETITWQYTLKPSTVPIAAYEDDEREYLEIAVIECVLSQRRNANRIAEIVHRAIPYPLLLLFHHRSADEAEAVALSVAHKRASRAQRGAVVAEGLLRTEWFEGEPRSDIESAFLASLSIFETGAQDFWALYSALFDRVMSYVASSLTGEFALRESKPPAERRKLLSDCRNLRREIGTVRAAIREETNFGKQIEMNSKLKQLTVELEEMMRDL